MQSGKIHFGVFGVPRGSVDMRGTQTSGLLFFECRIWATQVCLVLDTPFRTIVGEGTASRCLLRVTGFVVEHRLILARVRSEWSWLRAKGFSSVWVPASQ